MLSLVDLESKSSLSLVWFLFESCVLGRRYENQREKEGEKIRITTET